MDKAARLRWSVLLSVAAATAVASVYPKSTATVSATPQRRAATAKATDGLAQQVEVDGAAPQEEDVDPFLPRSWQPPPAPEPVKPPPAIAAAVVPAAPVGPLPLPFKFMGRMNDTGEGEQQMVYLTKGDQMLVAKLGETLEGTYKVLNIDADHIDFEYLPTGEKQALPLPAPDK